MDANKVSRETQPPSENNPVNKGEKRVFEAFFANPPQEHQIRRYFELLANEGIEWGLIGPREADRIWDRHIFNSLPITKYLISGEKVVDVGSGAGLPGIVIAIARPDLTIDLLEPLERRCEYLELVAKELNLTNVQIIRGNAERHKGAYQSVTSRAVANLPKFFQFTNHLVQNEGRILALKGEKAPLELNQWQEKYPKTTWQGKLIIDEDPLLGVNNLIELSKP
jgi:16S rRNA (guanine527-N7)-methyltransferase